MLSSLKKWAITKGVSGTLESLREKIQGKKVHAVQGLAIIVAIASYFYGPFNIGTAHFEAITTKELVEVFWACATASFFSAKLNRMK